MNILNYYYSLTFIFFDRPISSASCIVSGNLPQCIVSGKKDKIEIVPRIPAAAHKNTGNWAE